MRILLFLLTLLSASISWAQTLPLLHAGPGATTASGPCTSTCMTSPILTFNGPSAAPSTSVQNYASVAPAGYQPPEWGTQVNVIPTMVSAAGTISNLYAAPITTQTSSNGWTVTLYLGNASNSYVPAATALTCSIVANAAYATCSDTSDAVTVAPGDAIEWSTTITGTPVSSLVAISATFTSTSVLGQESMLYIGTNNATASNSAQNWETFNAAAAPAATDDHLVSMPFAVAGTVDQLFVYNRTALTGSQEWTMTVYHGTGGATGSSTSLTCNITSSSKAVSGSITGRSCSDTTTGDGFHVAAGDTISLSSTPSNTPPLQSFGGSVRFIPDSTNQYPFYSVGTTISASGRYINFNGYNFAGTLTTETQTLAILPKNFTLANMNFNSSTDPGNGVTRTINMREGTGSSQSTATGMTCTLTGNGSTSTSCNNGANTFSGSAGTWFSYNETFAGGTPGALTWFKIWGNTQ